MTAGRGLPAAERLARSLHEQRGRVWRGKWLHLEQLLTLDMQRHPTGDEHVKARALPHQLAHEWRGAHDLLEVVEDQEHPSIADHVGRPISAAGLAPDGPEHEVLVADWCQVDEQRAVGMRRGCPRRRVDREAGLPDATRANERHQPTAAEERDDLCYVLVAPDQGGERLREANPSLVTGDRRRWVEDRILAQHLAFERLQVRRRIDPKLVTEEVAERVVGGECVCLPA